MVEAGTLQLDAALQDRFVQLGIPTKTDGIEERTGSELREQVEAIKRCYRNDWIMKIERFWPKDKRWNKQVLD